MLHGSPYGVPFQLGMIPTTSELAVDLTNTSVSTDIIVTAGGHQEENPDHNDDKPGQHEESSEPPAWEDGLLEEVAQDGEAEQVHQMLGFALALASLAHEGPRVTATSALGPTVGGVRPDGVDRDRVRHLPEWSITPPIHVTW